MFFLYSYKLNKYGDIFFVKIYDKKKYYNEYKKYAVHNPFFLSLKLIK